MIVVIDHVFASGAVVGRCARSDGRPHSCVVARPTTAHDAKTWSISILPRSCRSQQSNRVIFKQNYPQLNRYHQLQINATFLGEYVAMHAARDDVTMVDKCKQSTTTSTTHENKKISSEHISRRVESVNGFIPSLCMSRKLSELCVFNLCCETTTIQSGNPVAIVTLSNLHNYPWVVLLQCTAFEWWRHGNRGLLLAEKGIPKLRTAPSWQNWLLCIFVVESLPCCYF